MSFTKTLIIGAVALVACRSDYSNTHRDFRSTPPESFATKDGRPPSEAWNESTAKYGATRSTAGDWRSTGAESFSTAEPYGTGDARTSTVLAHEHAAPGDDLRRADSESFSTSEPYVAGDRQLSEAGAPRDTGAIEPPTSAERDFLTQALNGGMFEVQSSELAVQKGVVGEHREFAEQMIEQHGKLNRQLEQLAKSRLLAAPLALDAKHAALLDELRDLERGAFTRHYHELQVRGHEDAIRLFERAERVSQDAELKAFAQRTLPMLRQHLDQLNSTEIPRLDTDRPDSNS